MQIITVCGIRWHGNKTMQQKFFDLFCFHAMASRFLSSSEDEIRHLLEEKDSKNTKRTYKVAQQVFQDYLLEKGISEPTEKGEIARVLKSFYVEARKKDGSAYTMGSLRTLKYGLKRYFKTTAGVDIDDEGFSETSDVYTAKCVELKKKGLAKVNHKPPIGDENFKRLYQSGVFSTDYPKTLLNKVFFEIMLCFCRRGRQNLRQLKKSHFRVFKDASGKKYVAKVVDELTKNHRENDKEEEGGMMYETEGPFCPVASFEKYLQHLNPVNEFLFQRPKKTTPDSDVWYDNMVIGERYLGDMMKKISKEADLSKIYSNHSIRATAVTILDKSGFEARHIMSVSGHRSESSIRSYSKTDEATKKRISETLTSATTSHTSSPLIEDQQMEPTTLNLSLLLTPSQEERILADVNLTSNTSMNTKVDKHYTFHNCNVVFNN